MVKPHGQLVSVSSMTSQSLHTWPINVVVSNDPLGDLKSQWELISKPASRLDAFSGYQFRT